MIPMKDDGLGLERITWKLRIATNDSSKKQFQKMNDDGEGDGNKGMNDDGNRAISGDKLLWI